MVFKYKQNFLEYRSLTIIVSCLVYLLTVFAEIGHLIFFKCLSYILILMFVCCYFEDKKSICGSEKVWNAVEKISYCSFGIYVFHQYILWNITRIPHCVYFIKPYMEGYYVLFPILLFVFVFTVSYGITHFSLKTQIGRYLLL